MSEETITIPLSEYEALKKKNEELTQKIEYLLEEFHLSQKHRFGTSSEKNKVNISEETIYQLGFVFNESEAYADAVIRRELAGESTVKEHKRKKYVTNLENLPENVEVEVIDKDIPEEKRICNQCGAEMEEIGVDIDRKVKLLPAKFVIVETRYHSYKCVKCDKTNAKSRIVRAAEEEKPVIPGGNATAEAIAYIATEKYLMHSPLYRLEQQLNASGIPLSRQTMSNWLLKSTELYFEPMWKRMHEILLKEEILHADETTLEVLREPGRKAQSKSYMWLYRTGKAAKQQLILYEYQETREAKHPKAFLAGFKGYLHTDGYSGYHNLSPDIRVVGCLAHARRNFTDAVDAIRNEEKRSSSPPWLALPILTSCLK